MRIGKWDCDGVCKGCEKENDPAWCLHALVELAKEVAEEQGVDKLNSA